MTGPTQRVIVDKNVPVPMRDGTVLRADVYRPEGGPHCPVLLTRLPYSKDIGWGTGYLDLVRLAQRGYIAVVQDVRGRYQSGGDWVPFEREFEDGFDTVVWATELLGADGRVGTFGASYFGMTQWQAAVMRPPGLAAMAPAFAWGNYLNGTICRAGARELGLAYYWHLTALAPDSLLRKYAAQPSEIAPRLAELVKLIDHVPGVYDTLPLAALPHPDVLIPQLFEWLQRPIDDPYWQTLNVDARYGAVTVPTMHIAGWYDVFLAETLRQFEAMKVNAVETELPVPQLIIGPWTHGSFSGVQGQLDFGLATSGLLLNYRGDLTTIHLDFFDAVLHGRRDALLHQPRVQVFVMGENRWRGYDDWPIVGVTEERWYLHSKGQANTRSGDGRLSLTAPADEPSDTYRYDPRTPVPTIGGALLMPPIMGNGPLDQCANEDRDDVICYTSEAFEQPYTILGSVSVTLHAASSAPDTDFVARLVDVHPDGTAITITDGIIRASARDSYPKPGIIRPIAPTPIESHRAYAYSIDLWSTGITLLAGHRLRLEVTSSSFPRWDRNLNTGQDAFCSTRSEVAAQRIFHDAERASYVTLQTVE